MKTNNQKTIVLYGTVLFISIITLFIILQITSSAKYEKQLFKEQVIQEAKSHFQSMVDTRSWNSKFGGVYVKEVEGLHPNPYLKENTLLTDKNETLIKINPAWMTRQISDISNKQGLYHYKITSLLPINKSNKADGFETKALKYFEKNPQKKYFYNFDLENKTFNLMGSLITDKSCMQCHAHQGYQVGDIRGGLRVTIPAKIYNQQIKLLEEKTDKSIMIILLISSILMGILYLLISMFYKRQYEIENAKEILEEQVSQRTHELKVVLSHEQHLKDVLKIITEVNEILITSFSTKSILKTATLKLSSNSAYPFVLSGLINEEILEIISKSSEENNIVKDDITLLKDSKNINIFFNALEKARKLKHPIVEQIPKGSLCNKIHRRESDLKLNWMIILPLIHDYKQDVYGIIAVFCSKDDGFELEEMNILENMANDISMALYSHKQRDSILAMEKEKTANYEETILAFVNIIEQRDTYTAGHTIRVAEYCNLIAKEMGYDKDSIHRLEKAAILHDIGKVATPDTILLKPGKLSHLEYKLIKQHSEIGADMLEKISIYKDLANIIRYHHSRYDGKGYPRTSSPDEIPMLSHIMIVADAFDAMTTSRIYRPRKSIEESFEELKASSGTQFHPDVVDAAIIALKDVNIGKTTQMPSSELERRRMSYFFQDSMTGLYNENYLLSILNSAEHEFKYLDTVDLKNFTKLNKENGWEVGDIFLKDFSKFLKDSFPHAVIIRYHGDDFIILNKAENKIDPQLIYECKLIKDTVLETEIIHYDLNQEFDFDKIKKRQL